MRQETVIAYAFPDPARTASAQAKRARRVRDAMARLAVVRWMVDERRGMYTVCRPWIRDRTPWNRDQRPWNRDLRVRDSAVSPAS